MLSCFYNTAGCLCVKNTGLVSKPQHSQEIEIYKGSPGFDTTAEASDASSVQLGGQKTVFVRAATVGTGHGEGMETTGKQRITPTARTGV